MAADLQAIKNGIEPNQVIEIIKVFIPDLVYQEEEDYFVLPTICHHLDQEEGSLKLYYYFNTKLFFCYTQCGASFDIFELVKKMLDLRGLDSSFPNVLQIVTQFSLNQFATVKEKYESIFNDLVDSFREFKYKTYNRKILNMFMPYYYKGWIDEGINLPALYKFGIKYSIDKEQIIIPHYNKDGELIGIRARNLNPIEEKKGKYMPIIIEGQIYAHQLAYNLYGLDKTKGAIQKAKKAFIFEGEKSVLICESFYGENNLSVATCGKRLNRHQLNLLLKLGVQEVIICYDRMNYDLESDSVYFKELSDMCKKYRNYVNMSFIFDREGKIPYKSAPVDMGKEVFEDLLKRRVYIN